MRKSPYWYWYQFLRRSERYKECCSSGGKGELADLYHHFGDVHSLKWGSWWATHKKLFEQEKRYLTWRARSIAQLAYRYEDGDTDQMIILVNLNESKDAVIKDFERKLRHANKSKQGRPLLDTSFYHRYGLTPVPSKRDLDAMQRMLDVLDECRRQDAKSYKRRLKRYQIGNKIGITFSSNIDKETGRQMDEKEKKNRMTATVCRYLSWAKEMIANVEKGGFPKKIDNPSAKRKYR